MRTRHRFKKEGVVVSIRISPQDCISTLDAMDKTGCRTPGMTFPAMVSFVFTALLEEAKQRGAIPEPDMFQFMERMNMYLGSAQTRRAVGAGALRGSSQMPPERHELAVRLEELKIKKEYMSEEWTPADQIEFDRVSLILQN